MANIAQEDATSFTVQLDDGSTQVVAKTPDTMRPGGIYDFYKAPSAAPASPAPAITPPAGPVGAGFDSAPSMVTPDALPGFDQVPPPPAPTVDPTPVAAPAVGVAAPSPAMGLKSTDQTSTTFETPTIDPSLVKHQKELDQAVLKTARSVADQQAYEAQVKASQAQVELGALQKHQEEEQAKRDEEEARREALFTDVNAASESLKGMKIDNNRFWSNSSTGNKVMAGISIALGALGQAFTGGDRNYALEIIDKAIDRDIDEQKANFEAGRGKMEAAKGVYSTFADKVKDDRIARSASRQAYLDRVKGEFDAIAASNAPDAIKKNAAFQSAQVEALQQKELINLQRGVMKVTKTTEDVVAPDTTVKPKPENPTISKELVELGADVKSLKEMRTAFRKEGFEGGPVGGRMVEFKRLIGVNDPKEAIQQDRILEEVAKKTHRISGAGTTEKEVSRLGNTLPKLTDNPATFFAALDQEIARLQEDYEYRSGQYSQIYQVPKDAAGSAISFKPLK